MLPRKGSRAMPTAHSLPTLTDLGPRLRPIHEIILVHHLRVSLVSRGCVPWITLTAVCRPTGYESRIHFRDATTCESFRNRSLCNTVAIKALYHFFNCIVHFYLSYIFVIRSFAIFINHSKVIPLTSIAISSNSIRFIIKEFFQRS